MTSNNATKMAVGLALGAWAATPAFAALPADDFGDNARGPEWTLVQDDPSLAVSESNGRLEVIANNPGSPNFDALYLSNGAAGFRLSTAADFAIAIDYDFNAFTSSVTGGALGLVFGVGRDADGTDSAAIGFGRANLGIGTTSLLTVASRTDDVQSTDGVGAAAPAGTFLITYDADGDDLSFGLDGSAPLAILADTVRGAWGAGDLLVSFGARGSGFTTTSGQAFLDDFEVRSGSVVPEPATPLSLLASVGLWLRRRRA